MAYPMIKGFGSLKELAARLRPHGVRPLGAPTVLVGPDNVEREIQAFVRELEGGERVTAAVMSPEPGFAIGCDVFRGLLRRLHLPIEDFGFILG